jgi:hypothetical protein
VYDSPDNPCELCQSLRQSCTRRDKEWGPRRQQESLDPSSAGSSIPQSVIRRPGRVFDHWNLNPREKLCLQNAFLEISSGTYCRLPHSLDPDFASEIRTPEGFASAFGLYGDEKWSAGVKFGLLALGYGLERNRAVFDPELSREYLSACRQYAMLAISSESHPARDLVDLVLFMFVAAILNWDEAEAMMHAEGLRRCLLRLIVLSKHPEQRAESDINLILNSAIQTAGILDRRIRFEKVRSPARFDLSSMTFLSNLIGCHLDAVYWVLSGSHSVRPLDYPVFELLYGFRCLLVVLHLIVYRPISHCLRLQR